MLGTRVALHNALVSSMIRYRGSFYPPSDRLVCTHRPSAQLILNAHWQAIPHAALLAFGSLGFQSDLNDVEVWCKAALLASAFSPTAGDAWRVHDEIAHSDEAALVASHNGTFLRQWHAHSSCTHIKRSLYLLHCGVGQFHIDTGMTQRHIVRIMRTTTQVRTTPLYLPCDAAHTNGTMQYLKPWLVRTSPSSWRDLMPRS